MDFPNLLIGDGASRVNLCRRALDKATKLLSSTEATSEGNVHAKAESVLQCLQTLTVLLKDVEKGDLVEIGSSCFQGVCVPFLRWLSNEESSISQPVFASALKAVTMVLGSLVEGDNTLREKVILWFTVLVKDELCSQRCLSSEETSKVHSTSVGIPVEPRVSQSVVLPALQLMLESATVQKNDDLFSELFDSLLRFVTVCDSGPHFFLVSSTLLPLFITCGREVDRLEKVWKLVKSVHSSKTTVELNGLEVVLTLLCCFHDVFIVYDESSPFSSSFPKDLLELSKGQALLDLRKEDDFWAILQDGLTSADPLLRKRCMYLLHCVLVSTQKAGKENVSSSRHVFWWESRFAKQLSAVWNDLVLVLETLEEKQVHIVKPVKKHLQNLITATRTDVDRHSLLHISWLMVALSRIFVHHEAKSIIKWGVQEALDMPLDNSPLLKREHWSFVFGPLLNVMNETSLYGKDPSLPSGSSPPVAESLCQFLHRFTSELHPYSEASVFLTRFLSSCYSLKMAEIPLVFVTFALSKLPPQPLLGVEALAGIRSIVLNCLLTHKPSFRAAIQRFLLTVVCNLADVLQLSCVDVVQTLGCFRSNECLLYNSSPWKQACRFLVDFCKASTTQSSSSTGPVQPVQPVYNSSEREQDGAGGRRPLFSFLSECVANCTREDKDPSLPGATRVARVILLSVHAELNISQRLLSTDKRSLAESLALLVAPVMDLLAGARARLYLSHGSVVSSLELLTSLLGQWLLQGAEQEVVGEREVKPHKVEVMPDSRSEEGRSVGGILYKNLLPWLPDVLVYVQERLLQEEVGVEPNLQLTDLYLTAMDTVYRFMTSFGFSFDCSRDIGPDCVARQALSHLRTAFSIPQVTPGFLGAVTALSWVCTLPMMSSETDLINVTTGNGATDTESTQLNLLTQQKHGFRYNLALSISQLPLNIVLSKPESCSTPATSSDGLMGGDLDRGGGEGSAPTLIAAKRKTEWGPLITHCYSCYWKCVLFSLKQLHSPGLVGGEEEEVGGVSHFLATSLDRGAQTFHSLSSPTTSGPCWSSAAEQRETAGVSGSLVPIGSNDMNAVIKVCLESLDLVDSEVPTVVDSIATLLPKILRMSAPSSVVVSIAKTSWPLVLEQLDKHNRSFQKSLKSFVEFIFHPLIVFLCSRRDDDDLCVIMQREFIDELFVLGEARSGVFNVVVGYVCDTWLKPLQDNTQTNSPALTGRSQDTTHSQPQPHAASQAEEEEEEGDSPRPVATRVEAVVSSMKAHTDLLMKAALFGPVHKKNIRIVEDVECFINSCDDGSVGSSPVLRGGALSSSQADKAVRVYVINFLLKLITLSANPDVLKETRKLLDDFLLHFVISLTNELQRISAEKPRYYINSATHRAKLRLMQCLIVASARIDEVGAGWVTEQLLLALQYDNQLSVRYLIEWQTILLLSRYPALIDSLFLPCLGFDSEKRLSRMCSILTIAMHVGHCLKEKAEKEAYYFKVFPLVYQWTSSYHFIARLYSQQAVFRMWAEFSSLPSLLEHFQLVESLVMFMKQNGDGFKFQHKMNDNVFFTTVEATADVSIETLFYTLPRLCRVTDEELVPVELFKLLGTELWRTGIESESKTGSGDEEPIPIKLRCTSKELLSALDTLRETASAEECGSETRSISHHLKASLADAESAQLITPRQQNEDTTAVAASLGGDVQKKITPWSNPGSVVAELFPGSVNLASPVSSTRSLRCGEKREGGLILVASLLNKIPNLGGLARTSEIFGVSELILNNVKVLEEKQFQSLSVTAEKWLTITEVKLPALRDYLLSMKRRGYALVGAEQTANSRDLVDFNFEPNTVLVLGNEREGIPVPIIHLLDNCVEIPQLGMVRSLNAHVSGAILIWEYVKQYLVKKDFQC